MIKGIHRKINMMAVTVCAVVIVMLSGAAVYASVEEYGIDDSHYDDEGQKVYDYANLLTDAQETEITDKIVETAREIKLELIIVTINDSGGKSSDQYAADFYDEYRFGYDQDCGSGALMLIDMDNRQVSISTAGMAMVYIGQNDIDDMLDRIAPYLTSKSYVSAADAFIKDVESIGKSALGDSEYSEAFEEWYSGKYETSSEIEGFYDEYVYKEEKVLTYLQNPLISGIIALAVAGIAVLCMSMSAKTRITVSGRTYMGGNGLNLTNRTDYFTHTTTTKRKIETDAGKSGGGGSNRTVSSSGRSHGGGSKGF